MTGNPIIGLLNPIRYRGYYYDIETGLYYLQTRYYDPETGRFINADGFLSTGQGVLGYNMYAYCMNNPVILYDPTGTSGLLLALGKGLIETAAVVLLSIAIVATVNHIVKNPPKLPKISVPKINTKNKVKTSEKAKENKKTVSVPKPSRRDPVHHIVAQTDHRARPAQKALESAGIDRFNDPANQVQLPARYHCKIHSDDYYEYVNRAIVSAYEEGGTEGIYSALAVLKWEISTGAIW